MNFEARKSVIAREIARELAPELGTEFVTETDKRLASPGTRSFGVTFSDAAAAAGLLLSCIQLAWQYHSEKRMDDLFAKLEAEAPKPEQVSAEQRRSIIRRVVERVRSGPEV